MYDIYSLYTETENYINEIAHTYINKHVPADPSKSYNVYELDVKSFAILSHAALEEYFEHIAQYTLEEIQKGYLSRKYSFFLLCFLNSCSRPLVVKEEDRGPEEQAFRRVLDRLNKAKSDHSQTIHNSHGAGLKFLRKMYYPLGIDIPDDVRLNEALKRLSSLRGEFAHKRSVTRVPAPEDVKKDVDDCLELARRIRDNVSEQFFRDGVRVPEPAADAGADV